MKDNRYKPIINNHIYDDDISYEDVINELSEYKQNGFGGIGINGRCKTKVSDVRQWLKRYFKTVQKYCAAAKELGLEMWIFDEWGFPSGFAAGLVLNEENRAKKLNKTFDIVLEKGESVCLPVPKRFITAGAMPIDRFAMYNPCGETETIIPKDGKIEFCGEHKTRLVVITWENVSFHTMEMRDIDNMPYDDPTVGTVDIMDYGTVKKFIDNMHERYAEAIGNEFGKTVKGFFYDEPEICWDFPYSPKLPQFFKDMHGYDIETILPELITYTTSGGIELGKCGFQKKLRKIYGDYHAAYTTMLAQNFYGQIQNWCHKHNLLSVGHQDMDNNICSLSSVSGDLFKNSGKNDMPGIDVIHDHIAPEKFADYPRYVGSIKRALGKAGAMSETFAVMGKFMPPDVMRYDLEYQVVRGIDKFFLYMNESDPNGGEYKKDIMERITFTTEMLNKGTARAKVAVFMPTDDIAYERMNLNPHSLNNSPSPWDRVEMLAQSLCHEPIDFDYAWAYALDDLYERGFRHLILTGSPIAESVALKIKEFYKKGGRVWSVFKPCEQIDFAQFRYNLCELIKELPHEIKMYGNKPKISVTSREINDGILYAFLNETVRSAETEIVFPEGNISYYDFERKLWIGVCTADNIKTGFAPRELKLFRIGGRCDLYERVTDVKTLDDWKFNGKPIEKLAPWTELGLVGFSGCAEYETEFDWSGGTARIILGEIGFSAKVYLNGIEHKLPFAPWAFCTELPEARHKIRVEVLNSGASEDYMIPDKWHRPYEQPYLRCGMLGEPKIEKIERI